MVKKAKDNLPAVLSQEEQEYLNSLDSGPTGTIIEGPKRLKINTKAKDADGKRRPIGAWHLDGTDIYSEDNITIRPIRYMNTLVKYNVDKDNNYTVGGETVYFQDFTSEIPDSLGGLALGRKFGRIYSEDEKAATRKLAETYLDIFCLVSFKGQDEAIPAVYRVRGSKLAKFMEAFRALPKDKKYPEFEYELEAFQPEGVVYWDIKVTPKLDKILGISDIMELDKEIRTFIAAHNERVMGLHLKNRGKKVEDGMVAEAKMKMAEVLPPNDLNDDLSFLTGTK